MKKHKTAQYFYDSQEKGIKLFTEIRQILLDTELEETVKWGAPCYVIGKGNVVGVAGFKNHLAVWFHQGVFLADQEHVLINAQENKTIALR